MHLVRLFVHSSITNLIYEASEEYALGHSLVSGDRVDTVWSGMGFLVRCNKCSVTPI